MGIYVARNRAGSSITAISRLIDVVWFYVDFLWEQKMCLDCQLKDSECMSTVLVKCFVLSFQFHNVVTYSELGSVFKETMRLVTSLFRHVMSDTIQSVPTRHPIIDC